MLLAEHGRSAAVAFDRPNPKPIAGIVIVIQGLLWLATRTKAELADSAVPPDGEPPAVGVAARTRCSLRRFQAELIPCRTLAFFTHGVRLGCHENRSRQCPGSSRREGRLGRCGGPGAAQPCIHGGVHGPGLLQDPRYCACTAGQTRQVAQRSVGRLKRCPPKNTRFHLPL